jgi:hypothetical protein
MNCNRIAAVVAVSAIMASSAAAATDINAMSRFVGTWSFDGTCASGDAMMLEADGHAAFDEWGDGLWGLADGGKRIVVIAKDISEEADRRKVAELIEFRVTAAAANKMSLVRASDGAKIEAVKCPAR